VNEVLVNFQYYEAVCEACDICPEVHRFYVKISVLDVAKIVELDLMNMKEDLCNDFF